MLPSFCSIILYNSDHRGFDFTHYSSRIQYSAAQYSNYHMASDSKRYLAIDVECVATGTRHDELDVCLVAVVDVNEEVIFNRKVKPEKRIVNYLTPLTGLQPGDLDDGERLSVVLRDVKALLGPDVVVVGQGLKSDIKWLQLEQGKDYHSVVDLAQMFKIGDHLYFSLRHEANTLIRAGKTTK